MTEHGLRMGLNVGFKLFPISLVVANFLAPGTDWQEAAQRADFALERGCPARGSDGIGARSEEHGQEMIGYLLS